MSLDIEAITAREDAATHGPWEHRILIDDDEVIVDHTVNYGFRDGICCGISNPADADFIAHAREDIPTMRVEIERLNGELERYVLLQGGYNACVKELSAVKAEREQAVQKIKLFVESEMDKRTLNESLILQPILNRIYVMRKQWRGKERKDG